MKRRKRKTDLDNLSNLDDDGGGDNDFDDDEVEELMGEYGLDEEEARGVKDLMDEEGLDADETVELNELAGFQSGDGGGGGIIGFLIIVAIIWGAYSFFIKDGEPSAIQEHPNFESYRESRDCSILEPDNPYSYGSGHYAGFEWAQNRDASSCGGNSDSFVEGCEEYVSQAEAYATCISL